MTQTIIQNEGLNEINALRLEYSLPIFKSNDKVNVAAQKHLLWMVVNEKLSHRQGVFGPILGKRLLNENFHWRACAENIAEGQPNIKEVIEAWMSDLGHRRNLLGEYKFAAFFSGVTTSGERYWLIDFATGDYNET